MRGKAVCGLSRIQSQPDCVIYSVGINHDSSFEAALLGRTSGCSLWGFDNSMNGFGPQVQAAPALLRRTHFEAIGLVGADTHRPNDRHKMYTLEGLLASNGHTFVDILKIDIEGWEFDVLEAFIRPYVERGAPLPFGQLQLEIHAWHKTFPEMLQWWELLEAAGLRPFSAEANLAYVNYDRGSKAHIMEYSFLNIKGDNAFINSNTSVAAVLEGEVHILPMQ